jgi:hypothetical protein
MTACATACACRARRLTELYEKTRAEGFGAEVQRRILIGTYVLSAGYYDAYYTEGPEGAHADRRDFEQAFEKCDVLLTPTAPGPPPSRSARRRRSGRDVSERRLHRDGEPGRLPGISVPAGLTPGPAAGPAADRPAFDEATLLRAGGDRNRRRISSIPRPNGGGRHERPDQGRHRRLGDRRVGDRDRLEVHAQVTSKSKLFSGASTEFGAEPNSQVSWSTPPCPACCR